MNQYYVTGYMGQGAKRMLYDLNQMEYVKLIDDEIGSRLLRFVYYRVMNLLGSYEKHPKIKSLFYPFYTLYRLSYNQECGHTVIFFNSLFWLGYDEAFLKKLKKKHPQLKLILYIVDPMSGFSTDRFGHLFPYFETIYCVNKKDCETYGFHYYPLVYSKIESRQSDVSASSDLFYLGSGIDRNDILHDIALHCNQEHVKTDIRVMDEGKAATHYREITYYDHPIAYDENMNALLGTNCMLEVMHEGFDNPTQRYTEAVAYNKKLLTNNSEIIHFPYYHPDYMKVFENISDIDPMWICKKEDVNYQYNGDFSPVRMIEEIDKLEAEGSLC
ncbi:MAG: hypothetical protein GX567_17640 [Clostridia bacterium]|nr:hypothetical protein [Clostridia bacterium]